MLELQKYFSWETYLTNHICSIDGKEDCSWSSYSKDDQRDDGGGGRKDAEGQLLGKANKSFVLSRWGGYWLWIQTAIFKAHFLWVFFLFYQGSKACAFTESGSFVVNLCLSCFGEIGTVRVYYSRRPAHVFIIGFVWTNHFVNALALCVPYRTGKIKITIIIIIKSHIQHFYLWSWFMVMMMDEMEGHLQPGSNNKIIVTINFCNNKLFETINSLFYLLCFKQGAEPGACKTPKW